MMKYDVYLPIGENCAPAYYLRACGLRTEAYPLDWMGFSAPAMIRLFRKGFRDFFYTVVEEKPVPGNSCRCIRDTVNNIHSMHHFPMDREIADVMDEFHDMMRHRYLRLHDRLTNGSSLLMLGHRQATREQLESTLLDFSEMYPHLSIHLVNVQDNPEMASTELRREDHRVNDRLSMSLYHFNNRYDTVNDKKFGIWGNEAMWQRMLQETCE